MDKIIKDNRREFLLKSAKIAGVTFCGCILGSLLTACDTDEMSPAPPMPTGDYPVVKIADVPALATVGGFALVTLRYKDGTPVNNGRSMFIFRMEEAKFVCLDTICLHKNANVSLKGTELVCDLHSAKFAKESGAITDLGFAGESFPPLTVYTNTYDAITGEIKVKV